MRDDDVPACELNRMAKAGLDFGFPYCHGGDVADPEFGALGRCAQDGPPVQQLGPRVAPLGVKFYTGTIFPAEYRNQVFIAEHGSWNRSTPAGYRVTRVGVEGIDKVAGYQPFISGWLREDGTRWGRPADVMQAADGSLLIADDHAGAIYRVVYQGN